MSGYPVVLDGGRLEALVVGGGAVAARKAGALLEAGARVRVVAPAMDERLRAAAHGARLTLVERRYQPDDIGDALLVVAATGDRAVNAEVAADAHARRRLVNVVDAPDTGNCIMPAVHRAGALVVAVATGGVPTAAARIRDAIAERFDSRYDAALTALARLRERLLGSGDAPAWRDAADALAGEDFCAAVERGGFEERVARWR